MLFSGSTWFHLSDIAEKLHIPNFLWYLAGVHLADPNMTSTVLIELTIALLVCGWYATADEQTSNLAEDSIPNYATGYIPLTPEQYAKLPRLKSNSGRARSLTMIPSAFDAREKWPKCSSIKLIRDQGRCGTCWAVSGASVMSDRVCIASEQNIDVTFSANQAAACTFPGQTPSQNCQAGGFAALAYQHAAKYGLSTGGEYKSKSGCVPYSVNTSSLTDLACSSTCTNDEYKAWGPSQFKTDLMYSVKYIDGFWAKSIFWEPFNEIAAERRTAHANLISDVQNDIMNFGPVTACIRSDEEFTRLEGQHVYRGPPAGSGDFWEQCNHEVRIIGWNKTVEGTPYWLVANSWGPGWGNNGVGCVEMGRNVAGIESGFSAPVASQSNPCVTATFCDKPIDQAINFSPKDPHTSIFLFQGKCAVEVAMASSGHLSVIGKAELISKKVFSAPPPPITSYIFRDEAVVLTNTAKQGKPKCKEVAGRGKVACEVNDYTGTGTRDQHALAIYYDKNSVTGWESWPYESVGWFFRTGTNDHIYATALANSAFVSVNALLNVDGKKMLVFGKNAVNESLAGVLQYPSATHREFTWEIVPQLTRGLVNCEGAL